MIYSLAFPGWSAFSFDMSCVCLEPYRIYHFLHGGFKNSSDLPWIIDSVTTDLEATRIGYTGLQINGPMENTNTRNKVKISTGSRLNSTACGMWIASHSKNYPRLKCDGPDYDNWKLKGHGNCGYKKLLKNERSSAMPSEKLSNFHDFGPDWGKSNK